MAPRDFNSYGSRRGEFKVQKFTQPIHIPIILGNDDVMARGTFSNIRLVNKFMESAGPRTLHFPSNEELDVFDCAQKYAKEKVPLIILAGKDYGSGSR